MCGRRARGDRHERWHAFVISEHERRFRHARLLDRMSQAQLTSVEALASPVRIDGLRSGFLRCGDRAVVVNRARSMRIRPSIWMLPPMRPELNGLATIVRSGGGGCRSHRRSCAVEMMLTGGV